MARGRDRPVSREADGDPGADLPDDGTADTPHGSDAGAAGPWYRAGVPPGPAGAGQPGGPAIRGLRQPHISAPVGT
jgi:hypothetical protein